MNRSERRNYAKQGGMNPYQVQSTIAKEEARIKAEVDEQIARAKVEISNDVILKLVTGVAMILHDKHGYGKVRLNRFIADLMELYDSIDKGLLTNDDVAQVVRDELGIEFKRRD